MPEDLELTPALVAAGLLQLGLFFGGLVVLWRVWLSPAARQHRREPARLPRWEIGLGEFGFAALFVIAGGLAGQLLTAYLMRPVDLPRETKLVIEGAGFQFGMLCGIIAAVLPQRTGSPRPTGGPHVVLAGAATVLAAFPVLTLGNLGWIFLLEKLGVDTSRQPLVEIFANAEDPLLTGLMAFLAVVLAPLVEEPIFRGGLFRYLHTRLPRPAALLIPALIFSSMHLNWVAVLPLCLLAIALSLAYERTGRIEVAIIAHALFNLNTMLLLLAGVEV